MPDLADLLSDLGDIADDGHQPSPTSNPRLGASPAAKPVGNVMHAFFGASRSYLYHWGVCDLGLPLLVFFCRYELFRSPSRK